MRIFVPEILNVLHLKDRANSLNLGGAMALCTKISSSKAVEFLDTEIPELRQHTKKHIISQSFPSKRDIN